MKTDDWFSPTKYRGQCIYCRREVPPGAEWIQIDSLEQRDENGQIVRYAYMYIVRPYLVVRHGTPGDDRVTIMIPPDLVDDYMRALGGP